MRRRFARRISQPRLAGSPGSGVVPSGSLVRIRLDGDPPLTATLTRRSTEALKLEPGTEVIAQIKATALHAYAAP